MDRDQRSHDAVLVTTRKATPTSLVSVEFKVKRGEFMADVKALFEAAVKAPNPAKNPRHNMTMDLWEAQRQHKLLKGAYVHAREAREHANRAMDSATRARMESYSALSWFENFYADACKEAGCKDFSEFVTIEKGEYET